MSQTRSIPAQALLVMIVLVDLMGFTLVMPLLQRFASDYGFKPWQIGAVLAAFPLFQLIAGPILGRLSDRYGRRPVLVASQFGTALSFALMAVSREFWVLLLARAIDGASGGNVLVAQAYLADVTKPEERGKALGLLGAAFGVGFVLGPLLGGVLVKLPIDPDWQLRLPFVVAALFSTIAWVLVWLKLPESLPREKRAARFTLSRGGPLSVVRVVRAPKIGRLVVVSALLTLTFSSLEGTFSNYLKSRVGWDAAEAAWAFAFLGLISAMVQGGLIRPLINRFGEPRLVIFGVTTLALGMVAMALMSDWWGYLAACILIALGYGTSGPSVNGLLSRSVSPVDQGLVFGVVASCQTLARMINYMVANLLLGSEGSSAPYWEAAFLALVALAVAWPVVVGVGPSTDHDATLPSETLWSSDAADNLGRMPSSEPNGASNVPRQPSESPTSATR